MASSTAASPLPPSPTPLSPVAVSPNISAHSSPRSSPRSSPKMKSSGPSPDTCAMILSWLRTAVPAILQSTGHRSRPTKSEHPVHALASTLQDGVVLAELVSFLDPLRLAPTAISRSTARNALSLPSSSSPPTSSANIDAHQMFLQYKNNTRRVIAAVKMVLDDVRSYSGFPHRPAPGAVDAFLGNVSAHQPSLNLRPSICLAQLVIATAVYGPRHNEFRHSIWRFPSKATQTAFHAAMTTVAQAVALPPPGVLYAAGPPPPSNMPSPAIISPHPIPHVSNTLSPHPHIHSPRPPLSPLHVHSPTVLSPRASAIPNAVIAPHPVLSPTIPNPQHPPISPRLYSHRDPSRMHHGSPHHKLPPAHPLGGTSSPLLPVAPLRPVAKSADNARRSYSPRHSATSSRRSSTGSPRHSSSQSPRRSPAASPRRSPAASPGRSPIESPRRSPRRSLTGSPQHPSSGSSHRPSSQSPRIPSVSNPKAPSPRTRPRPLTKPLPAERNSLTPLTRNIAPDAKVVPLIDDVASGRSAMPIDDGMMGRKFSMITDEESQSTSPPEQSSALLMNPQDVEPRRDASGDLRAVASGAEHVVESDISQSMLILEEEHRIQHGSSRYEDASIENEPGSKRSSDEFYTPKEISPSRSPIKTTSADPRRAESDDVPPTPSEDFLISPPITSSYMDTRTNRYYKDTKVDETVRHSVATSITEHISRTTSFGNSGAIPSNVKPEEKYSAPRLFQSDSNTSSLDMRDASYLLSPSASDAPSPSNKWQISHQKGVGQDILSPMPLSSPPPMPARSSRAAMSTQVTPPLGSTFRSEAQPPHAATPSPLSDTASKLNQNFRDGTQHQMIPRSEPALAQMEGRVRDQGQSSLPEGHGLPPRPQMGSKNSQGSTQRRDKQAVSIDSESQSQTQAGKSRVSFAPTIISPGGHIRPLGEPLRGVAGGEARQVSAETRTSSEIFSLPPSAAGEERDVLAGCSEHLEGRVDEHEGSHRPDDHTSNEEPFDTGRSGEDDMAEDGDELGDEDESYMNKETFEEVEEIVVYNSDDDKWESSKDNQMEVESTDDSIVDRDHGDFHEEDPVEEGVFDEDEEYVEDSSMAVIENEEHEIEPAAEEDIREERTQHGDDSKSPLTITNEALPKNHSTVSEVHNDLLPGTQSGYVPSHLDFVTPPIAVRYSRQARARALPVPATPPSPPNIATLMESISESKLTGIDDEEDEDGPVSTMEPSAGLFQKLIAVWQSADEQGQRPGSLINADVKEESALHIFVPEVSTSLSSAQESTLRSGDTETEHEKVMPSAGETSARNHRPRAMRLPSPTMSPVLLGVDVNMEKREEVEEGTSMASFSDAFSSDDKDRQWPENAPTNSEGGEWEEAMKGDIRAGLPLSPSMNVVTHNEHDSGKHLGEKIVEGDDLRTRSLPRARNRKNKAYSVAGGVVTDGHHVKVDRRRLDWLTRELLAARDAISRKELQMTFAETQRLDQEEILLLEREDAESMVGAMKKILTEREHELHDARNRLSVAIQSGPNGEGVDNSGTVADRTSVESRSSNASGRLEKLVTDGYTKMHERFDECHEKQEETKQALGNEMHGLWSEFQRGVVEKMTEMTERRDGELEVLRRELSNRERLIVDLQQSSCDLVDQNRVMQAEASELRLQKDKAAHRYELEMSHVTAQVELVNEFSKKLHDNFRETENLRQQVLQYQGKLSHITSTSGVSQRQIKELREAVTRANDECARLRREADLAEKKGMEAVRRAEEMEELRYKDGAGQSGSRYPDRQDSGSFRSHEPVRPAGQNRPGGSGANARYHQTRTRALPGPQTPAQKAWLQIREKISVFVRKDGGGSRRRIAGHGNSEGSRSGSASQSSRSHSQSRSRGRDDDTIGRSRSGGSRSSNGSGSVGDSSVRSGPQRSNRSGGGGPPRSPLSADASSADGGNGAGEGGSTSDVSGTYQQGSAYGQGEVGRIRATDF